MDRRRQELSRQSSSGVTPEAPGSPMMSPLTRHVRSGSTNVGQMRKPQTKAAAQRLAAVMAQRNDDDDDDDEDDNVSASASIGLAAGRAIRPRSPMTKNIGQRRVPQLAMPQQPSDEDREDDDTSVGGTSSNGRAIGRAVRPRSPMARNVPQRRVPQVMSQPSSDEDRDEDDLLVKGTPSIGLSTGRAVRPRSPMIKNQVQKRTPQVSTQPADEDTDEDDLLVSGRVSIGLAGGRSMRARSPMTKNMAQRRAQQAMPDQPGDEDNNDNDLSHDSSLSSGTGSIGFAGGRKRMPSSVSVRNSQEQASSARSTSFARVSSTAKSAEPLADRSTSDGQNLNPLEQPLSAHSTSAGQPTQSRSELEQPLPTQSAITSRSAITNSVEQPSSANLLAASRPSLKVKTVPMVPPSVSIALKPTSSVNQSETPKRDKRLSVDFRNISCLRERGSQNSASVLQDELDLLQEENDVLLEKLRLAEERFEEAEERTRQLEKEVAAIGEGVTLDADLLGRKEAALQQREAALRVAEQSSGGRPEEVAVLRAEAEIAKNEATSALEQIHEFEREVKSLRQQNERMVLTQEEMEEVVLKRCWLARYWSLCHRHGVLGDIAGEKFEYWSSLAPLPDEIVLEAGQNAKEDKVSSNNGISGEGNIETMLLVEKGLRELASLKAADAVALALAQNRHSNSQKSDEVKLPIEGQFDAFELSKEESEDVRFKQAWLIYFWRRAKTNGVEPEIADERLQFWINQSSRSSSSHDAVEVERGLVELRKLSIECQLWQKTRQSLELQINGKSQSG